MHSKKPLIVITGPTGVGKTDLAFELGKQLPIEIINADVGQFYTPLTIGTAKPEWRNSDIPHHLFDSIDEPTNITVTQYRSHVERLCSKLWDDQKIPVIVGGSHFYIASLFFPPSVENIEIQKYAYDSYSTEELWNMLNEVDADRAEVLHKNDRYRIESALNIWKTTGKKPSEYKPSFNPITSEFIFICLTRDRESLYERINKRTHIMLTSGWIEETQKLIGTPWEDFLKTKKIIGYDDIIYYLHSQGTMSLNELETIIAKKTRNYAKKQIIYERMFEKKLLDQSPNNLIETINLDDKTIKVCSEKLADFFTTLYTGELKKDHNE